MSIKSFIVSKDVETFENEIEENLTNKGIASETDNKEPCGACLLETETGPVSKTGLKMFSKTETVSENKDQVCVAWLAKTETGPVLKTVFGNRIQRENKYQIYGACLSEAFSNTNVVGTRMDTLDIHKKVERWDIWRKHQWRGILIIQTGLCDGGQFWFCVPLSWQSAFCLSNQQQWYL